MNIKKNVQQCLAIGKRFGAGATVYDLLYRSLERTVGLNIYRIMALSVDDLDSQRLTKTNLPTPRELTEDELHRFSKASPDHLPLDFVKDALRKGNRCFGVIIDDVLAAYSWFSRQPTEMDHSLDISFDSALVYQYKAYVVREYRGMRLSPHILRAALESYRHDGVDKAVAYIASNNYPSLKAAKMFGFRRLGTATIWHTARWLKIFATRGCLQAGLCIERRQIAGPGRLMLAESSRAQKH